MKRLIIFTALTALLVGCQSTKPNITATAPTPLNSKWQLQNIPNATLDLTHLPKAVAYAGCNQISFTVNDFGDGSLQIDNLSTTDKDCPYMTLENQFMQFLPTVQYHRVQGDTLTLYNDEGKDMVFKAY